MNVDPNKPTDFSYFFEDGSDALDRVDCLKNAAVEMNAATLSYYFLGPNSNSAVAELMGRCGRYVILPFSATGWWVPFTAW